MKTHKFLLELNQDDMNEIYYRYRLFTGCKKNVPTITAVKHVLFYILPECIDDSNGDTIELPVLNIMDKVFYLENT